MRTTAAREEQTLDIAAAVIGAAVTWTAVLVALLVGGLPGWLPGWLHDGADLIVVGGYVVTAALWLVVLRRRAPVG